MTLVELLVGIVLAFVVLGAPLAFMITSFKQSDQISSRTVAARQAQTGLDQLTRDLRQAVAPTTATPATTLSTSGGTTTASFSVGVPGSGGATTQTITWTCTAGGSCTRSVAGGAGRVLIQGVTSLVFTTATGAALTLPANDPTYVGITLTVQPISQADRTRSHAAAGITNPIVIQDGVELRANS